MGRSSQDDTAPSKPNVLKQSGQADVSRLPQRRYQSERRVRRGEVQGAVRQGRSGWRRRLAREGREQLLRRPRERAREQCDDLPHDQRPAHREEARQHEGASNQWHTLRVEFQGGHFTVTFNGQKALDWDDETFKDAGKVGVWTKADSVTEFDDFTYGSK